MHIFDEFDAIVDRDVRLAPLTWYGLGGPADYLIRPQSVEQLQEVTQRCRENDMPVFVIGFGSNLLIPDHGVRGAVIKLDSDPFCRVTYTDDHVTAWAGAELRKIVLDCVKKGLSGMEVLAGIPGSVGGAVRMNAGGGLGDIGSVVDRVTVMDRNGQIVERSKPDLSFNYRLSNITAPLILNATMHLVPGDPDQILRTVQETWIYKKNHQPLNTRSCGCVFKNPRGQSAGALIDRAGLKGLQIGGARVSEKHANFIVALEGCRSDDVRRLIETIQQRIQAQLNVTLETEIEIWS